MKPLEEVQEHLDNLIMVKRTGNCNMLDSGCVVKELMGMECYETVNYLMNDRGKVSIGKYIELLGYL